MPDYTPYDACCFSERCPQHLQWDAFLAEQERDDFPIDESAETDYNGVTGFVPADGWDQIDA